jgi:UDP-N-acetylmuramoyl-tripeptide--D-alanyl-D-alanine ligase
MQKLATYYLNKMQPNVIAVTGSNGKTTTKDLIAAVLSEKFVKLTKRKAITIIKLAYPILFYTCLMKQKN